MQKKLPLPQLAISACLTGQAVRYDGRHKYTPLLIETLNKYTTLVPVCPETAIGLSVPRNKIYLKYQHGQVRVLDTVNPERDLTDLLQDYALEFLQENQLSGLVLQEKSPSCGINNCKTFSENGEIIAYSSGVFSASIMKHLPELPCCCAVDLKSHKQLINFIERVEDYSIKAN